MCPIGTMAVGAHYHMQKIVVDLTPLETQLNSYIPLSLWFSVPIGLWACGVVMVRPMRFIVVGVVFGGMILSRMTAPALAFQETTTGAGAGAPPAAVTETEPPKSPADPAKPLNFKVPEVSIGKGTEIRIPGIGTVGVLPKLDFGLELLYGANDPKGLPQDRADPGDVQIRGTIKHRF